MAKPKNCLNHCGNTDTMESKKGSRNSCFGCNSPQPTQLTATQKIERNKKMKKVFAGFLAGAMALTLVACGGSAASSAAPAESGSSAAQTSSSKDFPNETITLVCPFSAGGGTDVGARNLATALSKQLGVNVVVENQTGSGGWVAWTDLIQGDYDDGYTIGLINHNFAMGELDPDNLYSVVTWYTGE